MLYEIVFHHSREQLHSIHRFLNYALVEMQNAFVLFWLSSTFISQSSESRANALCRWIGARFQKIDRKPQQNYVTQQDIAQTRTQHTNQAIARICAISKRLLLKLCSTSKQKRRGPPELVSSGRIRKRLFRKFKDQSALGLLSTRPNRVLTTCKKRALT